MALRKQPAQLEIFCGNILKPTTVKEKDFKRWPSFLSFGTTAQIDCVVEMDFRTLQW